VSDKEKDTSSTSGMSTSKATSPLLTFRAEKVVPGRMDEMERAYKARDFQAFGRLSMMDSNQFHATCMDTYPPIFYMTDVSKTIIRLCHVINDYYKSVKAAYTFDAGPNAVIYCLEADTEMIMAVMARYFPAPSKTSDYCSDPVFYDGCNGKAGDLIPAELLALLEKTGRVPMAGDVKYVFHTRAGPGPIKQPSDEMLLDPATGMPVAPKPHHKKLEIAPAPSSCCTLRNAVLVSVGLVAGLLINKLRN
jgi:diphosphomevalonate decarboxylase